MLPNTGSIFHFHLYLCPVPIERIAIDDFLKTACRSVLLDVRSPGEYYHAHLPGAVSIPLFTNEERAVVGTAYKQQSREQAIKIGLDFFGPKMRRMVEEVEARLEAQRVIESNDANSRKTVCIYCWRGGMRSGAIAWLLGLYGFNVLLLQGGYKRFRRWAIEKLAQPYNLKLLGGYTGSGKTELLHELERQGQPVIDLEVLAGHKGSAFGNIGLPQQPSQEQFENLLALQLDAKLQQSTNSNFFKTPCPIWVEDESQRIGTINIPNAFWASMRSAPVCFLNIPFENRLQHLATGYGDLNRAQMIDAIRRISKRLGPLETKNAIRFLEEADTISSFRILLQYYDKQYRKALHNRQNLPNLLHEISCATVDTANALLLSKPMMA